MKILFFHTFITTIILFLLHTGDTLAQSAKKPEYYIKAGYMANFARLVQWPENSFASETSPIQLCVLNTDSFGDVLNAINGKLIRGRKLAVSACNSNSDLDRIHILFLNSSDTQLRALLIEKIGRKPILTIGEHPNFAREEGILNFKTMNNKIRFEINRERAEKSGLKISSRLYKIGEIVSAPKQN